MWLGMIVFGLFLLLGALRWRIALQASCLSVPFPVLLRASLIGHLFNMVFFGPVGGDLAKTAAYARWHKYQLHDLLATAVIDRSFSAVGGVLVLIATFVVYLASPASSTLGLVHANGDGYWLVVLAALAIVAIAVVIYRLRSRPFLEQLFSAFWETAKQLKRAPAKIITACLLGFVGQVFVSFLMLICLIAITYPDTACLDYLWAFPLIAATAAIPLSVGGAGLREGAAMLLLGGCGAASEQIVVAGLLVLLVYVLWGLIGIPIFIWEETRHAQTKQRTPR